MVLAERNSELVRNGRRSRGPSPNGHNSNANSNVGVVGGGGSSNSGGGSVVGVTNPGGNGTPDTSSDDDNSTKRNGKSKNKQSEYEEKIRVGRDYQAVCPPLIPEPERRPEVLADRALLVWSPTRDIPDTKLEEYISVAKEKYGYNGEQALGMLFWHKHDLERAVMDLANFTPFPDEWTVEDKVLFEQAFQFHGKSFHRIRQMLPDKSIASLVKYYYSWKKTRHRQSVMDRQEKAKASKEGSENGSENGSNEESDDDKELAIGGINSTTSTSSGLHDQMNTKLIVGGVDILAGIKQLNDLDNDAAIKLSLKQRQQTPPKNSNNNTDGGNRSTTPINNINNNSGSGCCTNCGVPCYILISSPHGKLCSSCHHHWRRTGNKRPTSNPNKRLRGERNAERNKRKPPRGMYINHDDIIALASSKDFDEPIFAKVDNKLVSLLSRVQLNKQTISGNKRKSTDLTDETRHTDNPNRINSRWTNEEMHLAVEGFKKYGKDFQSIAEILGTKTEAHVRTFYINYRRRYNLDQIVKKFEAEKEFAAANATALAASSSTTANTLNENTTGVASSTTALLNNRNNDDINKQDVIILSSSSTTTDEGSIGTIITTAAATTNILEETDNGNLSLTTSTIQPSKLANNSVDIDKSNNTSSLSNNITQKDNNIIMEIDLDAEQSDEHLVPAKKVALSLQNSEYPNPSAV